MNYWILLLLIAFVAAIISHSKIRNYFVACVIAACAATIAAHLILYVRGTIDKTWIIVSVLFAALYAVSIAAGVGFPFLVWRVMRADRHRKREKLGLCLECGYNLHALTEPRCPECSTRFDKELLADSEKSTADQSQKT